MSKVQDDIANLLSRFGAKADRYLEMDNPVEYKEPPAAPVVVSISNTSQKTAVSEEEAGARIPARQNISLVPTTAVAAVAPRLPETRVEPTLVDAIAFPAVEPLAPTKSPSVITPALQVAPSSLRALLTEVALARQAEKLASNEDTLHPTATADVSPATPAYVIAVVSLKGGVGRSTVSAALAGTLTHKGRTVAIDLDPQNVLQYHLGIDVDDAVDAGLARDGWQSLLRDGAAGTRMLPYGAYSEGERHALERDVENDGQWLKRKLAAMNLKNGDVVILDTPAGSTLYLEQALSAADEVIVVITPDAGSFLTLDQLERQLKNAGNYSYLVNQFDASRTFCQDMLEVFKRRLGDKLIGVVPLDHAISEGLAFGATPLLTDAASPARQAMLKVSDVLSLHTQLSVAAGG